MNYPKPQEKYQHYKGGHYEIIGIGKHSETDEILVFYRSISFGTFHARPLDNFNEIVEIEVDRYNLDGSKIKDKVKRFSLIL